MNPEEERWEAQRFLAKQASYRGSARVDFKFLRFKKTGEQEPFLDPKNAARLVTIFELEGCLRADFEHHIPAIISEAVLHEGLARSRISSSVLLDPQCQPNLDFPKDTVVEFLDGRHRIAAGRTHLMPGDKWWTVDFYLDTLDGDTQRYIGENYANSRNICDGDFYREIRSCQLKQDLLREKRWLARLSDCKRDYLKQFQKRPELKNLTLALDRLLEFPGLWPALQLGNFHRLLKLKCPEELENYLGHIHTCWCGIVFDERDLKALVDFQTVRIVEMCSPGVSDTDSAALGDAMDRGTIFPMIKDPTHRSRILANLRGIKYVVPSLYTFFEDTKWLEPCAQIMKTLVDIPKKESIRKSLWRTYEGGNNESGQLRVLNWDLSFTSYQGSEVEAFVSGYRQLWLFAWRHFPELSAVLPRKDAGKPKPRTLATNEHCQRRLAQLAMEFGFSSDRLAVLGGHDPDARIIRELVRQARPPDYYDIPDTAYDEIAKVLATINRRGQGAPRKEERPEREVPRKSRCGRPHEASLEETKDHFFFNQVFLFGSRIVSPFTVNRDIFRAFFGSEAHVRFEVSTALPVAREPRADLGRVKATQSDLPPEIVGSQYTFSYRDIRPKGHAARKNMTTQHAPVLDNEAMEEDRSTTGDVSQSRSDVVVEDETSRATGSAVRQDAAASGDQTGQKVSLPQRSMYQGWKDDCADGDLFIIIVDEKRWRCWKAKNLDGARKAVARYAATHYFARYDSRSKTTATVSFFDVVDYGKRPGIDGVIFVFRNLRGKAVSNAAEAYGSTTRQDLQERLSFETIRGESTEERLKQVEQRGARKRKLERKYLPPRIIRGDEEDQEADDRAKRQNTDPSPEEREYFEEEL